MNAYPEKPTEPANDAPLLVFLVTEDWYFVSHRVALGLLALEHGFRVTLISRFDRHRETLERTGIQTIDLDMHRGKTNPLQDLRTLLRLRRLYLTLGPKVVHHVALKPVLLGSLAAWLARVPKRINALGGLGYVFAAQDLKARVLRWPVTLGLRLALGGSQVIVQNDDDRRVLARTAGVPPDRLHLIPGSGVDLNVYSPTPEPSNTDPVRIIMVSRLLFDKGVVELVEAARLLRERNAPVEVVLVGGPDPDNPRSVPLEYLRSWVAEGLIRWDGPREDIPTVWAQSHIAVLPSYYREGMPKSLLEAAACGRPIVTTDMPGCRDAIVDGETGLLVEPKDALALANAIERLVRNPALRRRFGLAGRKRAEQYFSVESVNSRILSLYT